MYQDNWLIPGCAGVLIEQWTLFQEIPGQA
jgi:hypothetical protein